MQKYTVFAFKISFFVSAKGESRFFKISFRKKFYNIDYRTFGFEGWFEIKMTWLDMKICPIGIGTYLQAYLQYLILRNN